MADDELFDPADMYPEAFDEEGNQIADYPGHPLVENEDADPLQAFLDHWQKRFRVLLGWEIVATSRLHLECVWSRQNKDAQVGMHPKDVPVERYTLHEMLHIAIGAIGQSRKLEELVVQDLVNLILEGEDK